MSNTRQTTQARQARAIARREDDEKLHYRGQSYRLADKIGVWPMMQLARAAEQGLSSTDSKGLAALHAMFEDMIHPDDWARFQEDMIRAKLDDPIGLLTTTQDAVNKVMERHAKQEAARANGNGQAEPSAANGMPQPGQRGSFNDAGDWVPDEA